MGTLIKNFFNFKNKIDFNFLSNLLDDNNFESLISSNCTQNFVFDSVFKIAKVEEDYYFKDIYNVLNNTYNIENRKTDLFIFFSLVSGNKTKAHRDVYDVYIIGLYGKTMYIIEGEEFVVEPGDLLKIPKKKSEKKIVLKENQLENL
jgi:mannose-6-phosphate isomerase-like protein (cupin superfamily)